MNAIEERHLVAYPCAGLPGHSEPNHVLSLIDDRRKVAGVIEPEHLEKGIKVIDSYHLCFSCFEHKESLTPRGKFMAAFIASMFPGGEHQATPSKKIWGAQRCHLPTKIYGFFLRGSL
jgi:hypothetical protein